MNRRGFLGLLAATPVAAVVAPDLVELLTPKRSIFLPPACGWGGQYIQRYTYQTHALGFAITEEAVEDMVYRRSGIMTAAQFRKQFTADLNKAFREAYSTPERIEERLARLL